MATPNEQILNDQSSGQAYKPKEKEELSLSSNLDKLSRVGGFDLLESAIEDFVD